MTWWANGQLPGAPAIAFGYFEALVNGGGKNQVDAEKQRLVSLNSWIENVGGISPYVFMDMADETFDLFDKISQAIGDRDRAMSQLLATFNNRETSNCILYHFRLLASTWLKANPDDFVDFVHAEGGIDSYCENTLQRHGQEIEHLGLTLLYNALLKPAGFVLEVAVLDRSAGSQVNTIRFPEEATGQHPSELGPIIHLLFRPTHYDLIYPVNMNIQVNRVATFSQSYEIANTPMAMHSYQPTDMQPLAMLIPGFGGPSSGLSPVLDATANSPLTSYTSSPGS